MWKAVIADGTFSVCDVLGTPSVTRFCHRNVSMRPSVCRDLNLRRHILVSWTTGLELVDRASRSGIWYLKAREVVAFPAAFGAKSVRKSKR